MSKVVHLHTRISTVFGVLDDDGNVIPQDPIVLDLRIFSEAAFGEAFAVITRLRDDATVESDAAADDVEQHSASSRGTS